MKVFISTWKPWARTGISLQQRVDMAKTANAEICIKGSNSTGLYGPDSWNIFKFWPYKGKSNDDLERLCKQHGIKVQLWCFPYLQYPAGSAGAIIKAKARWNPQDIFLDAEGRYVKSYPGSTGPFLRSLGDVGSVRYWLQSYRRPDYHQQVVWHKWLTYKDPTGKHIIHGIAPQAYPKFSTDWPADFARMITAYEPYLAAAGRPDIPWFPTLPTFSESGWTPKLEDFVAGVDFLKAELGERLVGLNFWRQQFLFTAPFKYILEYIYTLYEPPVEPPSMRHDWYTIADDKLREMGTNFGDVKIPPPAHEHGNPV
jgi:hypothetical protein